MNDARKDFGYTASFLFWVVLGLIFLSLFAFLVVGNPSLNVKVNYAESIESVDNFSWVSNGTWANGSTQYVWVNAPYSVVVLGDALGLNVTLGSGQGQGNFHKVVYDTQKCRYDVVNEKLVCWTFEDGYSANRVGAWQYSCRSGESCIEINVRNWGIIKRHLDMGVFSVENS